MFIWCQVCSTTEFLSVFLWHCTMVILMYSKSNTMKSCYNKCIKSFFVYRKYSIATSMSFDVQLPSFDTVIFNSRISLTIVS